MKRQTGRPQLTARRGGASRRSWAALAAVLLLGLAAAPAAQARRHSSLHRVVVHLRAADRALNRLGDQPASPLAAMYLARVEAQTAGAYRVARSIAAGAHGRASSERAATVLGLVADHQTGDAQTLSSILGAVGPDVQAPLAQAISTATAGRGVVLGKLSRLLPTLSTTARPLAAQVVALESSQGAQVPVQIASVLGNNTLACAATGAVQQALVVATQSFQLGLANLGPALALVPAPVRAQVQSEIDGIPALLRHIEEQLARVVPCPGSMQAATAGPVKALATPTLLGGITQLIDGILGRLLPGLSAGQSPAAAPAPASLTGLLGGGLLGGLWPLGR
jgi:hypothetical protein